MKISYMCKRENFYEINENTLKKYYAHSACPKKLYIYPELNAIVTARPSQAVKQYLYTEYQVSGSVVKRVAVWLYTRLLLHSGGLLASKCVSIANDADAHTLIYPCNKKYRIFHFRDNTVTVIPKAGFPWEGLANEIRWRTQLDAPFIPKLLEYSENTYTEQIIDGYPVARAGQQTEALCRQAFALWSAYIAPQTQLLPAKQYAQQLCEDYQRLAARIAETKKVDMARLQAAAEALLATLAQGETVPVSLSHGDLQPGNIWVENHTDKLYIIDWESAQRRSTWYDQATLFDSIRRADGLRRYARQKDPVHATVLMEDLLFRMAELLSLPFDYGAQDFAGYITTIG